MKFLLGLVRGVLPSWVPLALAGLLLAGLVAAYFGWRAHQREIGAAAVELADAKEVARVKAQDALISHQLVADLQAKQIDREASVAPVREAVRQGATACSAQTGPDVDAAVEWFRGVTAPEAKR